MEVALGIHRIEAPLGDRLVAVYLLVGEGRALLVDTGLDSTPRDQLLPYLETAAIEPELIRYVLTSHADFDHSGGNASLRELAPGASFLAHELDRVWIEDVERLIGERYGEYALEHGINDGEETKDWIRGNARAAPIDVALAGGELLRLAPDWQVHLLHTPGHSRGHMTVYDPRSRAAIVADAVLGSAIPSKDGASALPPTYRYVDTYEATIQRLQGMSVDILLTSHYPVYGGSEAAAFLAETRAYVEQVDAAVREELRSHPRTTKELIAQLAPGLGSWPEAAHAFLVYPLTGHLERLRLNGFLTTERGADGLTVWRRAA